MAFVKIRGVKLHITITGKGYPLVLIHGLGQDHSQYDSIREELSRHFRVIVPDCRGHGKSDKPARYTLGDHAADMLALMDYYALQQAHLLGTSAGSYVAEDMASSAPRRINRLVLTVPKSNGLTSSMQRLFDKHTKELAGMKKEDKMEAALKYFTYDPERIKRHHKLFEKKLTPKQYATAGSAFARFDFRRDLPKVTAETLVISGRYDGLNLPEEGKEVAALIPDATYVEMLHSGHLPMVEEPARYLKLIKRFLLQP